LWVLSSFAGGARVRLHRTLVLTVNMLKGLNDDGLRSSNWSPVGALEATAGPHLRVIVTTSGLRSEPV
jgi:hypothetical protein